jgi:hypothetical protein
MRNMRRGGRGLTRVSRGRAGAAGREGLIALLCAEFELVKQANWSDPNDQSAWLYHRWLVGKGERCLGIRYLVDVG